MTDLSRIRKPTLLLDEVKCRKNIETMAEKARRSSVNFRPHFKTHQSIEIGGWFREAGTASITVSSVTMAAHFAAGGWKDITIAFPMNPRETGDIRKLSETSTINILTTDTEHLGVLKDKIDFSANCFIKINTGNNRSGTDWDDKDELLRIADAFKGAKYLRMAGFLTHAGHAYKSGSTEEIADTYRDTVNKLRKASDTVGAHGTIITLGDTPSCSVMPVFSGIDEIRPGNFVFYDLMQLRLGSCTREQIAVAVACPVVEKNRKKREVIIYGGGVHLSKDALKFPDGRTVYGQIAIPHSKGWNFPSEDVFLRSISQEHGIIEASGSFFDSIRIGDLVAVIPVHSCMTADLLREYHTLDGRVIDDFSPK
jgi:D-serine deaminase-like pyridoxal phosphate-dependent protein